MLGGISSPAGALAAFVAADRALSYPISSSPSFTMEPTAAAAAEADPEIDPKSALAPALVTRSAPGSLPSIAITKFTSLFAIPPSFMRLPASIKNGIAVRVNELIPTNVRWAAVSTATFKSIVDNIVIIEAIPIEKAIGTPNSKSIANDIKITAKACPPILLSFVAITFKY